MNMIKTMQNDWVESQSESHFDYWQDHFPWAAFLKAPSTSFSSRRTIDQGQYVAKADTHQIILYVSHASWELISAWVIS